MCLSQQAFRAVLARLLAYWRWARAPADDRWYGVIVGSHVWRERLLLLPETPGWAILGRHRPRHVRAGAAVAAAGAAGAPGRPLCCGGRRGTWVGACVGGADLIYEACVRRFGDRILMCPWPREANSVVGSEVHQRRIHESWYAAAWPGPC